MIQLSVQLSSISGVYTLGWILRCISLYEPGIVNDALHISLVCSAVMSFE